MKCAVCGSDVNGAKCEKCGFAMVVALDEQGERALNMRAKDHKKSFVSRVKNISVKTFDVGDVAEWLRLCDGEQCYLRRVTSDVFPVNPAEITMERTLELRAEIDGKVKNYRVSLSPDATLPYWQVAVRLDADLKLTVMVGTKNNWDFGVVDL